MRGSIGAAPRPALGGRAVKKSTWIAALLLTALCRHAAWAQTGIGSTILVSPTRVVAQGEEIGRAELFARHLDSILSSEFQAQGFVLNRVSDGPYDAESARKAGCRWFVASSLDLHGGVATCGLVVRDAERGAIVSAEEFAAWGGPSLVTIIDAIAHRAAIDVGKARDLLVEARPAPLEEATIFLSPDEGARIGLMAPGLSSKGFEAIVDKG